MNRFAGFGGHGTICPILETSFAEIEQPDYVSDRASLRGLDHSRKDFVARLWHSIRFLLHLHIANGVELDIAVDEQPVSPV